MSMIPDSNCLVVAKRRRGDHWRALSGSAQKRLVSAVDITLFGGDVSDADVQSPSGAGISKAVLSTVGETIE